MTRRSLLGAPLAGIVKQVDNWLPAAELSRRLEQVQGAAARVEERYRNILSSKDRRLRRLRDENTRLKKRLAELSVDKAILQDIVQRRTSLLGLRGGQQRQLVKDIVARYGVSPKRAQRLTGQHRGLLRYKTRRTADAAWQPGLPERAQLLVTQGYREIQLLLQNESWSAGKKLAYRLYLREQLYLQGKLPRRLQSASTQSLKLLRRVNPFGSAR